jgi:glycosyltransferase involved in cell wall biosynthesis
MDPARFPWPWLSEPTELRSPGKKMIVFAGLVEELIKGFDVLRSAGEVLWQQRQDFELVATSDPAGWVNDFTRFVGWQSQADLPRYLRAADICVAPAIAQEALGRTAVEAMAVGRPVVASNLGGLPYTIADKETGLLFEPGDPYDLARKLDVLLDDAELREHLGLAGRRRFEANFIWEVILERCYRPVLCRSKRVV